MTGEPLAGDPLGGEPLAGETVHAFGRRDDTTTRRHDNVSGRRV